MNIEKGDGVQTITARIAIAVWGNGFYCASGEADCDPDLLISDCRDSSMAPSGEPVATYWIVAEVPFPEHDIEGQVEE